MDEAIPAAVEEQEGNIQFVSNLTTKNGSVLTPLCHLPGGVGGWGGQDDRRSNEKEEDS